MPCGMTHTCTVVAQLRMHTHWICTAVLTLLLCGLLSTACVFVYLCVSMQSTAAGGGGRWLHIVLGPVDPSQSEWSCLSSSALDSRGALILPDSQPREMMGRETAHSTHVTQRAGTGGLAGGVGLDGGGGFGRDVKTGRQRGDVLLQ